MDIAKLKQLEAYFAKRSNLPSKEDPLGMFVNNMRATQPERLNALKAKYGVKTVSSDKVAQKWIELEAYFAEHGKLPGDRKR